MELTKKTTILFSPALHAHLVAVARERKMSLGELVRLACEEQYGSRSRDERRDSVSRLRRLSLPIASVREMKRQSVPSAKELLP